MDLVVLSMASSNLESEMFMKLITRELLMESDSSLKLYKTLYRFFNPRNWSFAELTPEINSLGMVASVQLVLKTEALIAFDSKTNITKQPTNPMSY
jgi:antirestriction protein ArdC